MLSSFKPSALRWANILRAFGALSGRYIQIRTPRTLRFVWLNCEL